MIVGTIDAGAEALSVGVLDRGDMMLMYGSTIFIIMLTQKRVRDARLWYAPWFFHGQARGDVGPRDQRHADPLVPRQFRAELDPAGGDDRARGGGREVAARRATGWSMLPYFSGERTPIHDPHAKGVLFGLNLTHTRGDIYRAMFEGIACGTNHIVETYADAGERPRERHRGRRRHEEQGVGAGDIRHFGPDADRSAAGPSARPTAMRFSRRSASAT